MEDKSMDYKFKSGASEKVGDMSAGLLSFWFL
jgi:hypothetical protein